MYELMTKLRERRKILRCLKGDAEISSSRRELEISSNVGRMAESCLMLVKTLLTIIFMLTSRFTLSMNTSL